MKKGISLPIETTVIIVIAVIVLVALLFFFSGAVNPGIDRIKLEQRKADLCSRYVAADSECKSQPSDAKLKDELEKTCKDLSLSTVAGVCCSIYCPKAVRTQADCTAAGGVCQVDACSANTVNTKDLGVCRDAPRNAIHCCGRP